MNPIVDIYRVETSGVDGTIGNVFVNGKFVILSLEPPLNGNRNGISCIPALTYRCIADATGRHQFYKVLDVPGREDVEWHKGNIWSEDPEESNTEGCILTGLHIGKVLGKRGVLGSTKAMKLFQEALGGAEEFVLNVHNCIKGW